MRHRVHESPLPGWMDPAGLADVLFAGRSDAVWLDSGIHAADGMSYLGFGTRTLRASVADHTVTVDGQTQPGDVLDFLRADLAGAELVSADLASAELPTVTGLRFGWVGWLGYELHAQTMGVASAHRSRYADASLLYVDLAIAFDHAAGSVTVIGLDASAVEELRARVIGLGDRPVATVRAQHPAQAVAEWADADEDYLRMILACQAAIDAGDAYQLCLTTEVRMAVTPDPFDAYLALRSANPSHHGPSSAPGRSRS
jgi:para-aminobenzoate synthetase component 1